MGIPRGTARLLLEEHERRPFTGSILQLGRSTVYLTEKELRRWAGEHGVGLTPVDEVELSHDPRLADAGCLGDRSFFRLLGFDAVEACDISDWEGADHIVDLNRPVAEELHERFDVVFETGTVIQVFDLTQVLENLWAMTKPGGRVIHGAVPSNNHLDLGFVMASPTLFTDFYTANGWQLEACYLCEYTTWWYRGRLHSGPWTVYEYTPGCLDHLSYGRWGGGQASIWVVATKIDGATGHRIPQLGAYRAGWEEFERRRIEPGAAAGNRPTPRTLSNRATGLLEGLTQRLPWLEPAAVRAKRISEWVRRRAFKRKPPVVARY